jgi:hypothetical protein
MAKEYKVLHDHDVALHIQREAIFTLSKEKIDKLSLLVYSNEPDKGKLISSVSTLKHMFYCSCYYSGAKTHSQAQHVQLKEEENEVLYDAAGHGRGIHRGLWQRPRPAAPSRSGANSAIHGSAHLRQPNRRYRRLERHQNIFA